MIGAKNNHCQTWSTDPASAHLPLLRSCTCSRTCDDHSPATRKSAWGVWTYARISTRDVISNITLYFLLGRQQDIVRKTFLSKLITARVVGLPSHVLLFQSCMYRLYHSVPARLASFLTGFFSHCTAFLLFEFFSQLCFWTTKKHIQSCVAYPEFIKNSLMPDSA